MKLIGPLMFLLLFCINAFAQEYKYETSEPIDVPIAGWNKVLQMRNGNTLFFHFEHRKGIIVKVFDKDHKEIASQKHICKVLDINALETSFLDGIVDINGEGVILITQKLTNKQNTILLRIDANSGALIAEKILMQSESSKKRLSSDFLKDSKSDNYSLVCSEKHKGDRTVTISVKHFNGTHELVDEIPVLIDKNTYDNVYVKEALISIEGGIFLLIETMKIIQQPDRIDYLEIMAYLPAGSKVFKYKSAAITAIPSGFKQNNFAGTLNIFFPPTLSQEEKNDYTYTMMVINDDYSEAVVTPVKNKEIDKIVKSRIHQEYFYQPFTSELFINKNGLTTVIYTGTAKSIDKGGKSLSKYNIGITQLDDKGEEIWGILIPQQAYQVDYKEGSHVFLLKKSTSERYGVQSANYKNEFYFFINSILHETDAKPFELTDVVYNADKINATCYKLNRKKEVSSTYILGKPVEGENKLMYLGSGDFKEETGKYAVVFEYRQGKDVQTKIAWVQLEP